MHGGCRLSSSSTRIENILTIGVIRDVLSNFLDAQWVGGSLTHLLARSLAPFLFSYTHLLAHIHRLKSPRTDDVFSELQQGFMEPEARPLLRELSVESAAE